MSARLLLALMLALTATSGAAAQTEDTDWQMYGTRALSKDMGGEQRTFFDAAGVVRRNDGHIEVWIKSLPVKELDRVQGRPSDLRTKIIDRVYDKQYHHGYRPPAAVAMGTDDKGVLLEITMDEVTADMAGIQPSARLLYELDCPNRLMRPLSVELTHNGKLQAVNISFKWEHLAPETADALLFKLVCAQHKDSKPSAP